MKRGFMLTAITVVLFMVLIDTAFQYSKSSSAYSRRISEMIVSEKVGYVFDDITEDVTRIIGLNITQQASDLIIKDSLPASNITASLTLYENFVRSYHFTQEIEARFLDKNDQQITLNNLSSRMFISPFNMSYGYPDYEKNNLLIQVPFSQSAGVQYIWYNLTVTTGNFSDLPSIGWNPPPTACVQGAPGCMKFYLAINDSAGNHYTESNFNFFDIAQPSGHLNVSFVNQSCWMEIQVGNQYLLNLTNHGCNISTQIGFNFNSSDLWLYFPEKLSIRDTNYNTSKKDNINLVTTKLLR